MEPKLMNCCKLEPMGTQGFAKMLKRIQVLEDGRIGRSKDKKEENHKKGIQKIVE